MMLPMGDEGKERKRKTFRVENPRNKSMASPGQLVKNPRLCLIVACLWPFAILALFASSAPGREHSSSQGAVLSPETVAAEAADRANRFELRKILDRVDVMGYGPTHPRVAFVVVGETKEALIESVESVFSNTDLNRIFVVCAVLDDGNGEDQGLVKELRNIEMDSVPHWHGLKRDIDPKDKSNGDEEEESSHSPKIHAMFHSKRKGLAASRFDAADFVQILARTHEDAGFKSPDEDIILMLLQGGSKFKDPHWLSEVTPALIVAPPLLGIHNQDVAMKLANAISLHAEGPSKRTSFNALLQPIVTDTPASDVNLSSGRNFPTPALNGAAIAMRLGTFLNLPETDHSLAMDPWSANLDLSLNLWLCADGIDILEDVEAIPPEGGIYPKTPMGVEQVAQLASVWMDDLFRERFFQAYAAEMSTGNGRNEEKTITRVEWEIAITNSQRSMTSHQLYKRCRTFEWYIQEVNTDLSDILDAELKEDHRFDPVPAAKEEGKDEQEEEEQGKDGQEEEEQGIKGEEAAAEDEQALRPTEAIIEKEQEAHIAPPELKENQANKSSDEAPEEKEKKAEEHSEPEKKKPSKPLRPTNLEIVEKPKMVDTTFVDVSGGHVEHPHKLALDANGEPGYVHDETALRKNPPPLNYGDEALKQGCALRDNHSRMMNERIIVETDYDKTMNESGQKRDKIFCLVYTTEKGHDRIPNIRETWGPKCDGFMVGSTKTDVSIGAVNILHEGPEEYDNIWQKVRSMWSYIYDNYYEKYDWFHIGGDDLFLMVENLRYYLESDEIRTAANGGIYLPEGNETRQTPLLLGRRFSYMGDMDNIFDSGGSGYTMNKAAFKLLVTEGFPNYFPHLKTFSEDTMVATLFKKIDTILPYDTKDDAGGERYMPFLPGDHLSYRLPDDPKKDWYAKYSIDIKEGLNHCSPQSVAFHYVKGDMMKRLFALAYGLCPKKLTT